MNAMYDKGREAFGDAGIAWRTDTIIAVLLDTASYTVNFATDQFLAAIPLAARVARTTLSGKTNVAGVLDAADINYLGLSGAPSIEALALYKDTGDPATSPLIAYIDDATGLPVAAGAAQVNVVWDDGPFKILKL